MQPPKYRAYKGGMENGLLLITQGSQSDYLCTSQTAGFKLVIHNSTQHPFPDSDGINVSPGTATNIALSRVKNRPKCAGFSFPVLFPLFVSDASQSPWPSIWNLFAGGGHEPVPFLWDLHHRSTVDSAYYEKMLKQSENSAYYENCSREFHLIRKFMSQKKASHAFKNSYFWSK